MLVLFILINVVQWHLSFTFCLDFSSNSNLHEAFLCTFFNFIPYLQHSILSFSLSVRSSFPHFTLHCFYRIIYNFLSNFLIQLQLACCGSPICARDWILTLAEQGGLKRSVLVFLFLDLGGALTNAGRASPYVPMKNPDSALGWTWQNHLLACDKSCNYFAIAGSKLWMKKCRWCSPTCLSQTKKPLFCLETYIQLRYSSTTLKLWSQSITRSWFPEPTSFGPSAGERSLVPFSRDSRTLDALQTSDLQ